MYNLNQLLSTFKGQVIGKDLSEQINSILSAKEGSKIKIKKSHEGSFTKYCGGNVTDECIRRGKASKDPKIRKRATFAANSRRWSH